MHCRITVTMGVVISFVMRSEMGEQSNGITRSILLYLVSKNSFCLPVHSIANWIRSYRLDVKVASQLPHLASLCWSQRPSWKIIYTVISLIKGSKKWKKNSQPEVRRCETIMVSRSPYLFQPVVSFVCPSEFFKHISRQVEQEFFV